ncbi:MAG: membrane protein insertion efficiency factor YidD [Desulfuromonadales bacterium]|nr:membrane protein insertion efficiency factor YidD [Desulfuromonadales bacterium]
MQFIKLVNSTAVKFVIGVLRFYKRFLSPFTGASCRFYPTCSEYSIQAIQKYGLLKGAIKTIIRIGKCHPFHPGGYDPVR